MKEGGVDPGQAQQIHQARWNPSLRVDLRQAQQIHHGPLEPRDLSVGCSHGHIQQDTQGPTHVCGSGHTLKCSLCLQEELGYL
ncbi:hypothetical protein DPEC_G00202270 [Dallia pectoralis]|uniref:Uncharacterized protein n=1 Tax=Dallia pectoralis TaxID=75939 RepID=A0ACC2G9N6_DALPE|nr:hypothetical protein DPEC_G00202270 [Dallia pectoralis]